MSTGWSVTATSIVVPQIIIGEHIVTTDPASGALLTAPVTVTEVPVPPTPAIDIAQIVEQVLSANIEIPGLSIMPLRSALSRLFSAVTDISGSRLPALSAANAVLEASTAAQEARLAAEEAATQLQALKDAQQDADAALNALNDSSVAASVMELSGRIADISGAFGARIGALEAVPAFDDSALRALIADVSGGVSAAAAGVAAALAAIADVSGAVATKAADADLQAYISSNDAAVAAKADASVISSLESRVGAVESSVPTKVAQADYDVYVAANDAAVSALDGRVTAAETAVAAKAEASALSSLETRVASVEAELPNKASGSDLTDTLARVIVLENSNFAPKLEIQSAADYAAWAALGANKIASISSSPFDLDAGAADNTILFAVADVDVTFTSGGSTVYEMVAGESATLAKGAAGWSAVSGIVQLTAAPAPPAPPAPSYPAAWASLPTGDFTAVRRAATSADVPSGFTLEQLYPEGSLIEVKDGSAQPISTQTNYVWYETVSGKAGASSPGVAGTEGFFTSLDATPLASFSYVLISVGGTDPSDAGVTYRVAITNA